MNDETFDEVVPPLNKKTPPAQSSTGQAASKEAANVLSDKKVLPNENQINPAKKKVSNVDLMLKDQTVMYSSDEDEEEGDDAKGANKKMDVVMNSNKENTAAKRVAFQTKDTVVATATKRNSTGTPSETSMPPPPPLTATTQMKIVSTLESQSDLEQTKQMDKDTNAPQLSGTNTASFINGIFPSAKRLKKIDAKEISSDIFKLKKLTALTYLVPCLTSSSIEEVSSTIERPLVKSMPHFLSLDYLAEEAGQRHYMKCKVTAKLYSYSLKTNPHISTVFVNCKKCNYINFTPFHLANIHQGATLSKILNDVDKTQNDQGTRYYLNYIFKKN